MSPRNWFGAGLTVAVFGLFGYYLHRGGELTATAGFVFGGGLLFCGVLIDADHFVAILKAWRGKGES